MPIRRTTAPHTPVSASVRDKGGRVHTFHVKVLGTEETWHTPSILLANLPESGGRAVFSQIHLEADPSQYEFEETKFNALKQSNAIRLEIFSDLLTTHFGMDANTKPFDDTKYTSGFFLGRHEVKFNHNSFIFHSSRASCSGFFAICFCIFYYLVEVRNVGATKRLDES